MEAIIFTGLQAAGKTSFYRDRFLRTHVRLSLDLLRTRHRETILLHACLAAQQPFVVDNTNPTPAARMRYVRLAHAAGFRAVVYYFHTTLEDALRRNAARAGKERIPDVALQGLYRKLQPPTAEEGFDAAYRVTLVPPAGYDVQPLP